MVIDEQFILEHFGTKGMKWGVRSANRSANRAKNRASRAKDRQKQDAEIDRARQKLNSGRTKRDFQKAKSAYAENKANLGSREARKILNKARNKKYQDINTSQLAKSGKERAIALGVAGAFGVTYLALRAAAARQ